MAGLNQKGTVMSEAWIVDRGEDKTDAVPFFDVQMTLPSVKILYRTASGLLESWKTKTNPTPVQLKRQAELKVAVDELGDWCVEHRVRP